ncbi:MAG: chitobiase/beta-hexosaminidase C-terminal domain-containing protein, partial [Deltaproteobacteria bacterium]
MFYVEGNKYIAGEEYYIDADPGAGNGIPVTAADGLYNAEREVGTAAIDTSNLSAGLHILYVRAQDSEGHWGTSRQYTFEVISPRVIAAAEYYVDSDPGKGIGTALNAEDANFDSSVENVAGTLNTSSLGIGSHTLYVRAKDSYGKWGEVSQVGISVTGDNTPPVVSAGEDQTKSGVFTQTATATDSSSMTYAWSKQAGTGTVTFGTANGLTTTISATLAGTYTIRFTATDAAANSSFDDMTLVWDTTAPTVAIGAPSATFAKSGPVTYTVAYAGADTVTLADANVTLIKSGTANGTIAVSGTGNTVWTATISGITGDGTLAISIAAGTASDAAGNKTIAAGPSAAFTVDNTPPVVNFIVKPNVFTSLNTANFTFSTNEASTYLYKIDGNTVTSSTFNGLSDGTHTFEVVAIDAVENQSSPLAYTWTVDTTAPTTTANPAGGAYGAAQSVTLSANEQATIYYATNGTIPTAASAVYSAPIPIAATSTLKFFAKDMVGNVEAVKTQTYTIGLSLAYILTISRSGSGTGAVNSNTAGIACGDVCSETYTSGAAVSVTLTAAPEAGSAFAGWSGDCSGTGTCTLSMLSNRNVTATFTLIPTDTTSPAGAGIVINGGAASTGATQVTLTLSASDTGSGMGQMKFSNTGTDWSTSVPFASNASWTLTTGDGQKTVYALFSDGAGNW